MKPIRKAFNSEVKEVDVSTRTLVATISTNSVDRMGDIIEPNGVQLKNFNKNPIVAWAHNYETPPIGRALWVRRKDNSLVSKVEFAKTEFAEEIFNLYKDGFMRAFSVGFVPVEKEPIDPERSFGPQRYKKWELLEFSAVPIPANPEALMMAMQKGVLKSENLIDEIQKEIDLDGKGGEEEDDPAPGDQPGESEAPKTEGLEELLAENEDLKCKLVLLDEENAELRFKLFKAIEYARKKDLEMTVGDFEARAFEIANGVIRAHTGRV